MKWQTRLREHEKAVTAMRRIFVVVALLLGALGSAMGQGADVKVVEIQIGDNMRFTPSVIEAHPDERLPVVLTGVGKMANVPHNFVLLEKGTVPKTFVDKAATATKETGSIVSTMREQLIAASPLVKSGDAGEVTFGAPTQPGEYTFVCTFSGHFNLGMKGQLIVK